MCLGVCSCFPSQTIADRILLSVEWRQQPPILPILQAVILNHICLLVAWTGGGVPIPDSETFRRFNWPIVRLSRRLNSSVPQRSPRGRHALLQLYKTSAREK